MKYAKEEVMQFVAEEDVKFIRLDFCDVFGRQKNISILPEELPRAFAYGIAFDASAIAGFGDEIRSDLLLHPDPDTLMLLPWRPEHGKIIRMFSSVSYPDGTPFDRDTRSLLKKAVEEAAAAGYSFAFGTEQEFYLFELDESGRPTKIPYDDAGYMDSAPDDKGDSIRREICLTLEKMGIRPESAHHEEGPGQNEIAFRYSDALTATDHAMTFRSIVKTIARRNGLYADFSPKPLENRPGNSFHINMSVKPGSGEENLYRMIAGIMDKIRDMTVFLNPSEESYRRLGHNKAPGYISWSHENRSQLIRIPAAVGEYFRAELRSPDCMANPYLAFTLLIYAGLHGLKDAPALPPAADMNMFTADPSVLASYQRLPDNLGLAKRIAAGSDFIRSSLPGSILNIYCGD